MADVLFGSAKFTWNDGSAQTHLCRVPLQKVRPAHARTRYTRESLDKQAREVANVGDGAYEIVARIRYENYADQVLALIKAGVDGYELTFYPNFSDYPAVSNVCQMIEPTSIPELPQEVDAPGVLEWYVDIRLRRMDGDPFDGVFEEE